MIMKKVEIRYQKISDAQRFYDILNNPNFIYFSAKPKSVQDEIKFLKKNTQKRKDNFEYNFSILYNKKLVGGAGIKIDQHQKHIGEIGYFVDEAYWGKGIAPQAVKLLEKIAFNKLKLRRLEIRMNPKNKASQKVALKAGYKKEGLLKKAFNFNGRLVDCYLYAKIK